MARNQYVMERNVSAPFFKGKDRKEKTFIRHPSNNRCHAVTRENYKQSVLQQGLVQGIMGE
eukprot:2654515-Pyramimonas_sp.AAC.1